MKGLSIILACFALLFAGCSQSPRSDSPETPTPETLTIATEANYAPFAYMNENQEIVGFDISLVSDLCAIMEKECVIVNDKWDNLLPKLSSGKYDAVIAGMSVTAERLKQVDFTDTYFANSLAMLTADSDDSLATQPMSIGVLKASTALKEAKKQYPNAKITTFETQNLALKAFTSAQLDAVLSDKVTLFDWQQKNPNNQYTLIDIESDEVDAFGIAVQKNSHLKMSFNQALQTYKQSGDYDELYQKYFIMFDWENAFLEIE